MPPVVQNPSCRLALSSLVVCVALMPQLAEAGKSRVMVHPPTSDGLAALTWEAPESGSADFDLTTDLGDCGGVTGTDGYDYALTGASGAVLWSGSITATGSVHHYADTLPVVAGERYTFTTSNRAHNFCDWALATFTIDLNGNHYDAGTDFSASAQGVHGWYYLYTLAGSATFLEMTYGVDVNGVLDWNDGAGGAVLAFPNDSDGDGWDDDFDDFPGDPTENADSDGDGVGDNSDTCPGHDDGLDADNDGVPDGCDACEGDDATDDYDADGFCDDTDNCPVDGNPSQVDSDGDGIGDACETDTDLDGVVDDIDNCPAGFNPGQDDNDGDGAGDVCDPDDDDDGVPDGADGCPLIADPTNADTDGDGLGDVCDGDDDGDGVDDGDDLCPGTPLTAPTDADGCSGEQGVELACPSGDAATCDVYSNHGDYVSCVTQAANEAKSAGLLTGREKATLTKNAARYGCE